MKISVTKKRRKHRMLTFLFGFVVLIPLMVQGENPEKEKFQLKSETPNLLLNEQDPTVVVQSVSTVSGDRLLHRPTFQMEQFLDGTLPGLYVNLSQGYPTQQASLNMRQRGLLIVVDGIPRADANIPASQIESVSLIKDALGLSAWGMSSGDGVLFIKTKRGDKSKLKIDFSAQLAFSQQIYRPEFLDAYEYGLLLNQALVNDGGSPLYSSDDLTKYRDGSSPYTHPNVDWYDVMMRNNAPIQQYNLNMSGGTNLTRYFIDINAYNQQGFLKQNDELNSYNTSESFKKYSLRANADVNLTPTTLLQVNVFGQMFKEHTPGVTMMGTIYRNLHTTPNNAYSITNPNGTYGGNAKYTKNLYAESVNTGYTQYPKTDFNIDFALEHRFTGMLKGLYVKGLYSYNSSYRETMKREKGYEVWAYTPVLDAEGNVIPDQGYTKLTPAAASESTTSYDRQYRLQYMDASVGYDYTAGEHSWNTKATYWSNEFTLMSNYLPMLKYGFNLHSEYNFNKRYMAEVSVSAMHFNWLSPTNRWGQYPTIGLGWNIDREDFFDISGIDALKLRTTYGLTGNDGTGSFFRAATMSGSITQYYYPYIKTYGGGGTVYIGGDNVSMPTMTESTVIYDPECEKSRRFTLAVDAMFLNRSLSATIELFNNYHYDILAVSQSKTFNSLHGGAAVENIGIFRQTGLELDVNYAKQFGDFKLEANAQATFYKRTLLNNGESIYPETYMQRVGQPYGQTFGYTALGIFQNQEEIDKYMSEGGPAGNGITIDGYIPSPGDIKYLDRNGDGNIDDLDVGYIGSKAPRIEYGFYLSAEWKGLALSMQWTGLGNVQTIIRDLPFSLNSYASYGQALKEHLDSWSEENPNPNANYPRVSASGNSYNERTSTFWLKNIDYLRLKNIELSYSLPKKWITPIQLSGVKFFLNGYNLLTITPLKDRDPELLNYTSSGVGVVPNIKAYNFGLNVQF